MNYNNYPYGIFNPQYLNQLQAQQMEEQRNLQQQKNIADMVNALSDFCKAPRKEHPVYQQAALSFCIAEVVRQMGIDNGGNHA